MLGIGGSRSPCSRVPPFSKHLEKGFCIKGCHGYLPFGLWLLLPANLLATGSQAHLFVMSLNVAQYNLGKVRLELMQSAVSPFTVCDLWHGSMEICRAFVSHAYLMHCCLLIIADQLKGFMQRGRISHFWLIFIFCSIELIFGRLTCFDMESIIPIIPSRLLFSVTPIIASHMGCFMFGWVYFFSNPKISSMHISYINERCKCLFYLA